jgi:predicted phosphodiesterase
MANSKVTTAGKVAREYCTKFPELPSRTLARTMCEQRPKLFDTVEHARSFIRIIRGNHGSHNRKETRDKKLFRPNGVAGMAFCPEPIKEPRKPFLLDGACRLGVISDVHIPYHDRRAVESAVAHLKSLAIDTLLLNGDILDFYSCSRFDTDPEQRNTAYEVRQTAEFLLWIRECFPKARLIFKEGNHDERYSLYLWRNAPALWGLKQLRLPAVLGWELAEVSGNESTKLEKYGWEYVTDKRMILAGKLPILHGHEMKASSGGVNAARAAYVKASHPVLIGHLHKTSQHTQTDIMLGECATWSVGCLCSLDPDYMPYSNKWNHGAAFVEIAADGEYNVHNFRLTGSKVRAS